MADLKSQIDVEQLNSVRQHNIGRLFLQAHRAFGQRSYAKLHERGYAGLSMVHTSLLANLDLEGTRITTLAERADMTKQSMGQLVKDLETQGYVERIPDPTDGRASLVKFTESGWQFLQDAYDVKLEIEAEYVAILGEERFQQLRDMLSELVNDQPT